MSTQFQRTLDGFRYADTHHGDDLTDIALRELGDSNRWHELAWINNLLPPYITDDPQEANDRVLLTGTMILIPAAPQVYAPGSNDAEVYLVDCVVIAGQLQEDNSGDIGIVAGRENLKQQLLHRVITPLAQLQRHPNYGCSVYRIRGVVNGPTAGQLGADYVKSALQSDFRVSTVSRAAADISGDAVDISAEVVPVTGGRPVDISSLGKWNPWPLDKPRTDGVAPPGGWGAA